MAVRTSDDDGEEEEIAPVPRPQNTRTIEIERFLRPGQIDARYFEKPYYIVPSGGRSGRNPSRSSVTR